MKFLIVKPSPLPILIPFGPNYPLQDNALLNTIFSTIIISTENILPELELETWISCFPCNNASIAPPRLSYQDRLKSLSSSVCIFFLLTRQSSLPWMNWIDSAQNRDY